jgi:hypothetical protein
VQGLPFSVTADDAEHLFEQWASQSTPMWSAPPISSLTSCYIPFWAFEADLTTKVGGKRYHKYADGAAMQVYGGHNFRRRMTEVLKNDTLYCEQFSSSMMSGVGNTVDVDEWSLFEQSALKLVREQVLREEAEIHFERHPDQEISVSYSSLTSRRIMMPAHVVE